MIHGYGCWWRVGVAETSDSERTRAARERMQENLRRARPY
jgi:3D-(3,5/4)-trihydroxycyclohexane-1,2-dione acylhydrolase (decyclizing)